jgi:hypothetical protein
MFRKIFIVALLALCSQDAAAEELRLGELPNMFARLAWAEKNCSGRGTEAGREVRIRIRKLLPVVYAEAELQEENAVRTGRYGTFDSSVVEACRKINWEFGIEGRVLPGFWITYSEIERSASQPPAMIPWGSNDSALFGDLVEILQTIYFAEQFCAGRANAAAKSFRCSGDRPGKVRKNRPVRSESGGRPSIGKRHAQ